MVQCAALYPREWLCTNANKQQRKHTNANSACAVSFRVHPGAQQPTLLMLLCTSAVVCCAQEDDQGRGRRMLAQHGTDHLLKADQFPWHDGYRVHQQQVNLCNTVVVGCVVVCV
jgi:hypothetical protein